MAKAYRQIIRLSKHAYATIHSDMYELYLTESAIINLIISNFYKTSNASYRKSLTKTKKRFEKMLKENKNLNLSDNQINEVLDTIIKDKKDAICQKLKQYSNDMVINIRLQNDVVNLDGLLDGADIFNGNKAAYFKMILEEYAEKNRFERFSIIYKPAIDCIKKAINNNKNSDIQYLIELKDFAGRKGYDLYFQPYRLTYSYETENPAVIGRAKVPSEVQNQYSAPIMDLDLITNPKIVQHMRNNKFSPAEIQSFENICQNEPLQVDKSESIDVSFTPNGMQLLLHTPEERPFFTDSDIRKEWNNRFIVSFNCSPTALFNYLLRFGHSAIILSPLELREEQYEHFFNSARIISQAFLRGTSEETNEKINNEIKQIKSYDSVQEAWDALSKDYIKRIEFYDEINTIIPILNYYSENGILNATAFLGDIYFDSILVSPDIEKATDYYLKAINQLSISQKLNLISIIHNGWTKKKLSTEVKNILNSVRIKNNRDIVKYKKNGKICYALKYDRNVEYH